MLLYESNSHDKIKSLKRWGGLLPLVDLLSSCAESSCTDSPTQSVSTGDDAGLIKRVSGSGSDDAAGALWNGSTSSDVHVFGDSAVRHLSLRFQWCTVPSTRASYDRGATFLRHSADFHVPVRERTRIASPAFTGQRTRLPQLKFIRWRSFWAHNLAASLSSLNSGIRRVSDVGSEVLQRRPIRCCAGLVSISSLWVLRQSRRAWNSLTPAARHFVKWRYSTNSILGLTITLRIPGTRSNMLKVPLVYEFRELRRQSKAHFPWPVNLAPQIG